MFSVFSNGKNVTRAQLACLEAMLPMGKWKYALLLQAKTQHPSFEACLMPSGQCCCMCSTPIPLGEKGRGEPGEQQNPILA
uniref:Uncharacterized protein n=1 Tax=Globodera rostochiensis TaxID=31243 RepID=A0A914I538_GLORO